MILLIDNCKYRPGEDENRDNVIIPIFNFNQNNYIPTRQELIAEEVENMIQAE